MTLQLICPCSWRDTVVGDHTKIDNLVQVRFDFWPYCDYSISGHIVIILQVKVILCLHLQIGHNVELGKNCMLCGQVGVAGSATYVIFFFFFVQTKTYLYL